MSMNKLSNHAYEKARAWLFNARPLDRLFYTVKVYHQQMDDFLAELARFQNTDGGFGQAIEPDFRLELSSPMATAMAFRYLCSVDAPHSLSMVRRGIQYLINTWQGETLGWLSVPPAVNHYPHAPWWHFDDVAQKCEANTLVNPAAELYAFLYHYREIVPEAFMATVRQHVFSAILDQPDQLGGEDVASILFLFNELPAEQTNVLIPALNPLVERLMEKDAEKWASYGTPPLKFAPTPASPFHPICEPYVEANIDYIISTQTSEGCWMPNWSWFGLYPEIWEAMAKPEWQGELTVRNLLLLQAYDAIEGLSD